MPKKINRELSRHPGGRRPLLDLETTQDFSRHPELDSGSESGMTLSREEIAQGVDSFETLPVPLRDDMVTSHPERSEGGRRPLLDLETTQDFSRHPELDSGSINGGRSPHITTCHRARVARSQKAAFTLAEVLITLSVIGIVAALTIPPLMKNHNEKAWSTAQSVFEKKLEVAARQMNTEEKLSGYSSTKDFVNELKKYIKITRVCDNDEITKCFAKEVIWSQDEAPVDMSAIKTAKNLGQEDWDTDTVAVQFANGVNAIIAYNPNATQDPYNNQFGATANSMAILYDVSGNKNPNTNGKDIGKINVESLGGVTGCMIDPSLVGDMCITQILSPDSGYSPMSKAECEQAVADGELGIEKCSYESDYWAGAVKACKGIDNMPTMAQLGQLATYVYNYDKTIGATEDINSGLTLDKEKADQFLSASPYSDYFYIWSGEEYSSASAYSRYFNSSYTNWNSHPRGGSDTLAVCLGD